MQVPDALTKEQVLQLLVQVAAKEVFDTDEAAQFLGVSKPLLELLRVQGNGPAYSKLGRLVRYRRESLNGWLLLNERNHTAEQ